MRAIKTKFFTDDLLPRGKGVVVLYETLDAFAQQTLFFRKIEIHTRSQIKLPTIGSVTKKNYKPNTAFAMMLRWISLEPPKIVAARPYNMPRNAGSAWAGPIGNSLSPSRAGST